MDTDEKHWQSPPVAQIFNLLYRRIAFGRALKIRQARLFLSRCGLKIRDTAD
jgi:hypothetical protein